MDIRLLSEPAQSEGCRKQKPVSFRSSGALCPRPPYFLHCSVSLERPLGAAHCGTGSGQCITFLPVTWVVMELEGGVTVVIFYACHWWA